MLKRLFGYVFLDVFRLITTDDSPCCMCFVLVFLCHFVSYLDAYTYNTERVIPPTAYNM